MRRACLLLLVLVLTGCGFEEPPAPAAPAGDGVVTAPAVAPAQVEDPCTDVALTLLDGQLNGLPSADPVTFEKAEVVVSQFVERYDAIIASRGVEAARAEYADEISAACAG